MPRSPAPQPDDITQPWWDATVKKQLRIQKCTACGHCQHYPRPFCLSCGNDALDLVEVSGRGTIHSFSIIHRSPYEDLVAPYAVALVDLEEGVRLLTRLVDCDLAKLACDRPVRLRWIKAPGENNYHLPVFKQDEEASSST